MGLIFLLGFIVAVSAATGDKFNSESYACFRGASKDAVSHVKDITDIHKPQFFLCNDPIDGDTRDHLISLDVARAFINLDSQNSLSCKTINWLNSRTGNVLCVPKQVYDYKEKFFKMIMSTPKKEYCFNPEKQKSYANMLEKTLHCFLAGAGSPYLDRTKSSCGRRSDKLLYGYGCCSIQRVTSRDTIFVRHRRVSEETSEDLLELRRFIDFHMDKLMDYCAQFEKATTPPARVEVTSAKGTATTAPSPKHQ